MIDQKKFAKFLEKIAETLDIPPGKYRDAVDRYRTAGQWLENGRYPQCTSVPTIYPQGSFRLGTVVRPIRNEAEADYDIDLVAEFPIEKSLTTAESVKTMVGTRLRENSVYRTMLDTEGKRCWTLQYAEKDGAGFHIDILPGIPESPRQYHGDTSLAITNKREGVYSWSASNPKGYGYWFDQKNREVFIRKRIEQQQAIQKRAPELYARIEDVPDALVRTPLQQSIQIAKRHRDMYFNNAAHCHAPISIIITTLSAHLYGGEDDVYLALSGIIHKLATYSDLMEHGAVDPAYNLIQRTLDGKWYIGNPANPEENFADRWHENNHARARAFFAWITKFQEDCIGVLNKHNASIARDQLAAAFGVAVVTPHIEIICPARASQFHPPKIHIDSPSKPWGTK